MKIIHIDTGRDFRGGQDALLRLAAGLRLRGHRQLIACPRESPLASRAEAEHLEVVPLEAGALSSLRRRIATDRFDIVHAHTGRAQNIAVLVSAGLPLRRVVSRQVAFEPRHSLIHRWKYAKTCHGVIANSAYVRRMLLSSGVPAETIEVISPGIQLPPELPSAEARANARAAFGFTRDYFVVGHAGAFTHEKGQDIVLDAALLLGSQMQEIRFLLAGDGPERSAVAVRAPDIVILPGFLDDLSEFYAALDLFIMPSRAEAWGLAALNAMAHGLAVIACDVGGLHELVAADKTGWLISPESPAALAAAVQLAFANPDLRREYGRNGRERAAQFTIERTIEQTEAFYARLLAAAPQTAT